MTATLTLTPNTVIPRRGRLIRVNPNPNRRREVAQISLLEFFRQSWEILEPETPLEINWHVELICEYLELVGERKLRNLKINIAPRHLKSKLASVAFPCWQWLYMPGEKFLCMSYAGALALDHNYDRRRLVQSEWYQKLADKLPLSFAKNRLTEFGNSFQGAMVARGLDGAVTGVGGSILIFDDPNNPEKIESQAIRESNLKKFRAYSSTRKNDPNAPIVVIQQRTAVDDISGWIGKNKATEYHHLCLPTEAEELEVIRFPKSGKTVVRRPGDLLHESRFNRDEVAKAKIDLGSFVYSARHQQKPIPTEGGMITPAWVGRYDAQPAKFEQIIISLDSASKAKELSNPWAFTVWGVTRGRYYLIDCLIRKMQYPDGKRAALSLIAKWHPNAILIEDKSTGESLIPDLKELPNQIRGTAVIAIQPEGDKITRMATESPAIESGSVWLPNVAPWLAEFESALFSFPDGVLDPGDSVSQFLRWIRQNQRSRAPLTGGSLAGVSFERSR